MKKKQQCFEVWCCAKSCDKLVWVNSTAMVSSCFAFAVQVLPKKQLSSWGCLGDDSYCSSLTDVFGAGSWDSAPGSKFCFSSFVLFIIFSLALRMKAALEWWSCGKGSYCLTNSLGWASMSWSLRALLLVFNSFQSKFGLRWSLAIPTQWTICTGKSYGLGNKFCFPNFF